MKDQKRLTCKVCGFKSDNLVPHIENKHQDLGSDPLTSYMERYEANENDVVHHSLTDTKKESTTISKDHMKIRDIELPKGVGGEHVPKVNSHYHFSDQCDDVLKDILENHKVLLTGHTGCGKTSMIEQIAARCNQGVIRANLNGQITIGDFVGFWTVRGGETIWIDGVLPYAMRNGLWLIDDEVDFAEPAILSAQNAVLEKNGKLVLKEKGHEIVEPHPNFRLFGTANTVGCMSVFRHLYQGTNLMNEAFLDRWRVYHIDYLPAEAEAKVLSDSVDRMNIKISTVIVRVANMIREAFRKEEISCSFSTRRMMDWASLMVRHKEPMKAAKSSIFSKVSPEDAETISGIIRRVMVGNVERS